MQKLISKKLLVWVLIFLTVVNISAIVFIFLHVFNDQQSSEPKVQKELLLNDQQKQRFNDLNVEFRNMSDTLIYQIRNNQVEMFQELEKENPDLNKLDNIADSIGYLHAELKRHTIRHFMEKGRYCTPEQRKRMFRFYRHTIAPDSAPGMRERKFRHRHRRGWNK